MFQNEFRGLRATEEGHGGGEEGGRSIPIISEIPNTSISLMDLRLLEWVCWLSLDGHSGDFGENVAARFFVKNYIFEIQDFDKIVTP